MSEAILYQLASPFDPRDPFCLIYLLGALFFGLTVMLWRRRRRQRISPGLVRLLAGSRALWLHRSTILDMKLFLMHGLLAATVYMLLIRGSHAWQVAVTTALTEISHPTYAAPHWLAGWLTTILQVLAVDLGYWVVHLAFHRIPSLWEIHKVHHSAEVMTPLTWGRQHPIEWIAFANISGLGLGSAYGITYWLFGKSAAPFELFHINILLLLFFATTHHLRHSGVWIAATGWLGHVIHSPAHHQIHHSTDSRHFDRNLGYGLSLFDWMFGTLHIPSPRGRVNLGVPEDAPHVSVLDTLIRPLRNAMRVLNKPLPTPAKASAQHHIGNLSKLS
jgi:sterol desaturase/sphingolipid hydroxylase (fatty acid hydroxylase superfamily)